MFNKHPKGLIPAALSNMGERFGYYIMNAVLVLFLCSKFGISEEKSTLIYSFFYAGIYLLSLVGGYIADKKQNYKGTIMAGLVIMAVGYVVLAVEQAEGSVSMDDFVPERGRKYAVVLGNEVKGVHQAVVDASDACLELPQFGTKHSLNVSVAAGIVIWEMAKMFRTR